MLQPCPHHDRRRRGLTLFEVAIALLIAAASVATVVTAFPAGLKVHQLARLRVYAAAKVVDLVENYNATSTANPTLDIEAMAPWDVPVSRRSNAPDLETRLASHRYGICPLPATIARRIDSEGDELQRILAEGGAVYYCQPQATTSWEEGALPTSPPDDAQRLVFAVDGYAQDNALFGLPWKAWPYYVPYPSPPAFVHHVQPCLPGDPWPNPIFNLWSDPGISCLLYERSDDDDVQKVSDWSEGGVRYGYQPYAATAPTLAAAVRYVQAALWYCGRIGMARADYADLVAPLSDFVAGPSHAQQARAYRYLAHAAMCLTGVADRATLDAGGGLAIPPATLDGSTSVAATMPHDRIVALHETCLCLGHRYATEDPYDWGAPRIAEQATMMDWPLLQWDLFSPPLTGTIAGDGAAAAQWRPLAPRPITGIGASMSYPADRLVRLAWGDPTHVDILAPFAAAERCRQLVFWAVDWLAYEDAETAPSAPLDASKWPRQAPPSATATLAQMCQGLPWLDMHLYNYRNPEKPILFTRDESATATGADIGADLVLNQGSFGAPPDRDPTIFVGRWGADRNFNKRLDRGPVPPSIRMRASTVARFNFYDLRVPCTVR